MADLRARFIEDYAGGLLNVSRQSLSSTGEVLAQDGFLSDDTLFVEDGRGVKSGLRLGSALAESIDPVTDTGVVNVRYADRTYAKIRDLKTFSTALASAQAALSESVGETITTFEGAFESLESDVQGYRTQLADFIDQTDRTIAIFDDRLTAFAESDAVLEDQVSTLAGRVMATEQIIAESNLLTQESIATFTTPVLDDAATASIETTAQRYYALLYVSTNTPAWVTFYTSPEAREADSRSDETEAGVGVIADAVTTVGNLTIQYAPAVIGYGTSRTVYVRVVNQSGLTTRVGVEMRYIAL
jgi:hypothetical protein